MAQQEDLSFKKSLLQVEKTLTTEEVEALVFLCVDSLDRDLSSVTNASTLFSLLMDRDILSAERQHLLADLLNIIRPSLIRELGLYVRPSETRSLISPYRRMLYDLSENITKEEQRQMKFLLSNLLPRAKLEDKVTTLEIFLEMERKDLLSETNLILLLNIITVCPVLEKKIRIFETMKGSEHLEGGFRQRSSSEVHLRNKPDLERSDRPYSCEISGSSQSSVVPIPTSGPTSLQSEQWYSLNSSVTTMGEPREPDTLDAHLSQGLSLLSTNVKSHTNPIKETSPTEATVPSGDTVDSSTMNSREEAVGKYPMMGQQRGFCLIINNNDFSKSSKTQKKRTGTDIDAESLVKVFTWLGFVTEVKRDCTRALILEALRELQLRDHGQMDCLVCCVLSHGRDRGVYGVDGSVVHISELKEPFNGHRCASLVGKPKVFFIQACQGLEEQKPVRLQADSGEHGSLCSDALVPENSIPTSADFLIGMATVPHFASFRDTAQGTWFIQSLCKNLVNMVPSGCDLVSILTKVNADVSQMSDYFGERKQMPQPEFSLRMKVVFPIPKDPPPSLFQKEDT